MQGAPCRYVPKPTQFRSLWQPRDGIWLCTILIIQHFYRFVKECASPQSRQMQSAASAPQNAPSRNAGTFLFTHCQSIAPRLFLVGRFCEIILFASASISSFPRFGASASVRTRKNIDSNALDLSPRSTIISRCVPLIIQTSRVLL